MLSKNKQIIIEVKNINKMFHIKSQDVKILTDISLTVYKGDFLILFGPSGCGKSTLLNILLGLEIPDSGDVVFLEKSIFKNVDEDFRSEFRKRNIGMVYQQANWIKSLTVCKNIVFPLRLSGYSDEIALKKTNGVLEKTEMIQWADYFPTELSSGQQQKVALSRAMVTDPEVLIADEPTGNLDFESGQELMSLLLDLNKEGKTIIMVTHDLEYLLNNYHRQYNIVQLFHFQIVSLRLYGYILKFQILKKNLFSL